MQKGIRYEPCSFCNSVLSHCPSCGPPTTIKRSSCSNNECIFYRSFFEYRKVENGINVTCLRCLTPYTTMECSSCSSVFSDCPHCAVKTLLRSFQYKKSNLIHRFLEDGGRKYTTPTSIFEPRKNTGSNENYTGVFLCHAELYILGDKYDIPLLRQLSLHRLHATMKGFTLYPSRLNDISTLAKYVFWNTCSSDKIREMITLYYACIVEDASKHDGLESLLDEVPDFAFGLISMLVERLA